MNSHLLLHSRRGLMAITFSVILLLLMFTIMSVYTLTMITAGAQVRRAERTTRALYAAEAGLQVALQTGQQGTFAGSAGQGRYLVQRRGDTIMSLGAVERAEGYAALAAVTAQAGPDGLRRGTWRQAKPREYWALREQLEGSTGPPTGSPPEPPR